VTATVTVPKAGSYLLRLRLGDADGLRVTGTGSEVQLAAGQQQIAFTVSGGYLGDSGVNGPYRAAVSASSPATTGCPATSTTLTPQQTSAYQASDFPDYIPSLQRLRERTGEFVGRGLITASASRTLQADLAGSHPDLAAFRSHLKALHEEKAVQAEAFVRLDSLAQRRQGAPAVETGAPGEPAPPGPDPEVAAGREVA
jgi:hypothetical protein